MKLFQIFFLLSFIALLSCLKDGNTPCDTKTASKKEDCFKREFSKDEENNGAVECCYLTATMLGVDGASCTPVDQKSLDNLKDYISQLKKETGATKLNIDCESNGSNTLRFSALILLAILVLCCN